MLSRSWKLKSNNRLKLVIDRRLQYLLLNQMILYDTVYFLIQIGILPIGSR